MTTKAKKLTHYAYAVREGNDNNKNYWTRIGAVFSHNDGKGYNLVLDAFPVNGEIIIREPETKESQN